MSRLKVPGRLRRPVVLWLGGVCALIVLMVSVGGITRLTGSGLSMVDWKPIMGAIPPLSDADWQEAFARYQQFPQYKIINGAMNLAQFKFIFFWEYLHRLLGRLLGVAFFVPAVVFWRKGAFDRPLAIRLGWAFLLGGLQGALGWFMVKSGLVNEPHVSHYRLAAHLSLALLVLGYLFWILLDLTATSEPQSKASAADPSSVDEVVGHSEKWRRWLVGLLALLSLQIIYGAFVAGLKAGYGYPTFPTMNGQWVPLSFFDLAPAWRNFLENPAAVQFLHRTIAWFLATGIVTVWVLARSAALSRRQHSSLNFLVGMVAVQFLLGVLTILGGVPLTLAALHQAGACVLLLVLLRAIHAFTRAA